MDFHRQLDIVNPDKLAAQQVTLVGAGGIGSPTALLLAKLGVQNLTVYDPDVIEEHNLPNQMYRLGDLGRPKVEALAEVCQQFAGLTIHAIQEEFPLTGTPQGTVIVTVDSMAVRSVIWEAMKYQPRLQHLLDARMGAEEGRLYTLRPNDPDHVDRYEKTLYSDGESLELPCTARAIGYNTAFLASLIASQVQKLVVGRPVHSTVVFDLVSLIMLTPNQPEVMT